MDIVNEFKDFLIEQRYQGEIPNDDSILNILNYHPADLLVYSLCKGNSGVLHKLDTAWMELLESNGY